MGFFAVGFAARTRLADPTFLKSPEDIDEMVSKEFAALIRTNMTDVSKIIPFVEPRGMILRT